MLSEGGHEHCFGPYRLSIAQKALFDASGAVRLGGRALDILSHLVERAGDVVSKDELMAAAWPGHYVEEATLRAHIATLRKTIGDGQDGARYIANIPGRGYCFVAPISARPAPAANAEPIAIQAGGVRAPPALPRMIGRGAAVEALALQLRDRRLVTICGPGGIGKTTVAVAVAHLVAPRYADGVHLIDLAPVAHAEAVVSAFAATLGLNTATGESVEAFGRALVGKQMLLLVDNCEHVVETVAAIVEEVLSRAPQVAILATGREALGADGETVHHLPPLQTPPSSDFISADDALQFAAVELFVERAQAGDDAFVLSPAEAPVVSVLCRRLDGIPLAIELAAARIGQLGVTGLAAELDQRLLTLTQIRRSAQPRHRTLAAMLDWSYERLDAGEQSLLRRLSVFSGRFTARAAEAVCGSDPFDGVVLETLQSLRAKSLVAAETSGGVVYRLLDMTRAYAVAKLEAHGEGDEVRRRHAALCLDILGRAERAWPEQTRDAWMADYAPWIDDIRAGIDWAFSTGGDAVTGIELTSASVPLACQLSLMREFRGRVNRAISELERLPFPLPLAEVQLNTFLGTVSFHESGSGSMITSAYAKTVSLSETLNDPNHDKSATLDLFQWAFSLGDYPAALKAAEHLGMLGRASSDPMLQLTSDRQIAQASHFLGDHTRGRTYAERVLNHPTQGIRLPVGSPMQLNRKVSMRIILSRILWIEGFADQALAMALEGIELSASDLSLALSQTLALAACPIAIWRGETSLALQLTERLRDHARASGTEYWASWAEAMLHAVSTDPLDNRLHVNSHLLGAKQLDGLGALDWRYASAESLERVERGVVGWCAPEILRAEGHIALAAGDLDARRVAESYFERALELATRQGALAWRLRAAISLAGLMAGDGRGREGAKILAPIYEQFSEGFSTADLRAAKTLLETLSETV